MVSRQIEQPPLDSFRPRFCLSSESSFDSQKELKCKATPQGTTSRRDIIRSANNGNSTTAHRKPAREKKWTMAAPLNPAKCTNATRTNIDPKQTYPTTTLRPSV